MNSGESVGRAMNSSAEQAIRWVYAEGLAHVLAEDTSVATEWV